MPQVLHLHPMPAWEIPASVAVYGVGPSHPVAPGTKFHVALFANAKEQHVEAFQLRFSYNPSFASVKSVAVHPIFRCWCSIDFTCACLSNSS